MEWWWVYLAIGVMVGFLAGLLGIGGGMIMVPMLVFVFSAKGFPAQHLMHLALATSMATIIFTSLSSVRAHHRHGAVDWRVARAMAPGIVAGALAATLIAGFLPTRPLAVCFALFMLYASLQMFFEVKPVPSRQLPGAAGLFGVGAGIGALSSVLAAGGAFLSIPFLARCNVPLKRALGTAAANGFPIAAAGTVGYVLNGLRVEGLPDGSLGFVYLPALALIVVASMPAAPLGAKLAHRMPVKRLRIVFALMLLAIAARMLVNLLVNSFAYVKENPMKRFLLAASLVLIANGAWAQKSPSGNAAFDGLDKNRDGYLSKEEVAGVKELAKRHARFDANKDGRMSLEEYIKANKDNDERVVADSTITTKVKTNFLTEKGIPSTAISVETYEGTVILSGFVDNKEIVAKAGKLAAGVSGVKQVENKLVVK